MQLLGHAFGMVKTTFWLGASVGRADVRRRLSPLRRNRSRHDRPLLAPCPPARFLEILPRQRRHNLSLQGRPSSPRRAESSGGRPDRICPARVRRTSALNKCSRDSEGAPRESDPAPHLLCRRQPNGDLSSTTSPRLAAMVCLQGSNPSPCWTVSSRSRWSTRSTLAWSTCRRSDLCTWP
jgi:hypothetical protein